MYIDLCRAVVLHSLNILHHDRREMLRLLHHRIVHLKPRSEEETGGPIECPVAVEGALLGDQDSLNLSTADSNKMEH